MARHCPSVPARRTRRRSHGRGGEERAGLAGWPRPRGSQPRPPLALAGGRDRAARGGVWRCHQVAGLRGGPAAGARPRLDPSAQSPPGRRACPGRRSARTPPAGAPSRSGSIATPRGAARPPPRGPQSRRGAGGTADLPGFPREVTRPQLVSKQSARQEPAPRATCPFPTGPLPGAPSTGHNQAVLHAPFLHLPGRKRGWTDTPSGRGSSWVRFPPMEEGPVRGRSVPEAEVEALTRTSARAACGPEALLAPLQ